MPAPRLQHIITMTEYKKEFPFPVVFAPEVTLNCAAEWLAKKHLPQFHCAGERRERAVYSRSSMHPHSSLPTVLSIAPVFGPHVGPLLPTSLRDGEVCSCDLLLQRRPRGCV